MPAGQGLETQKRAGALGGGLGPGLTSQAVREMGVVEPQIGERSAALDCVCLGRWGALMGFGVVAGPAIQRGRTMVEVHKAHR